MKTGKEWNVRYDEHTKVVMLEGEDVEDLPFHRAASWSTLSSLRCKFSVDSSRMGPGSGDGERAILVDKCGCLVVRTMSGNRLEEGAWLKW